MLTESYKIDTVYTVTESCMRPGGAWAETIGRFTTEAEAKRFALDHGWVGPGFGIIRSRTISVTRRTWLRDEDDKLAGVDRNRVFERRLDD